MKTFCLCFSLLLFGLCADAQLPVIPGSPMNSFPGQVVGAGTNGIFWTYYAPTNFTATNVTIPGTLTASGVTLNGVITNTQTTTTTTNAWNWYWDVSRPFLTFNVSSNNPNLNGFSNLSLINNGGANCSLILSNQAAANATITLPAGCVIMRSFESNQPLTTLVITNGKKMQIDLTIIPGWTTNLKVWHQMN